jgi:diguanylate cyclase (GGDEF)-like protein
LDLEPTRFGSPERDLAASIAQQGYLNDLNLAWQYSESDSMVPPGKSGLEMASLRQKIDTLARIFGGKEVGLQITHAGRVRMAELSQALRSGKIREQYGILWDGRHFDQDLNIALLDASEQAPTAVAYLDMNGLKSVNDEVGHGAGDIAIRAYFQAINTALSDRGDAYRLGGGGDEVGVIVPSCGREETTKRLRNACLLVMREHLTYSGKELPPLSIAVGLITSSNPKADVRELRTMVDTAMYKAKEFMKGSPISPRPSSLNFHGDENVNEFGLD